MQRIICFPKHETRKRKAPSQARMVHIINGEIVDDDDARAQSSSKPSSSQTPSGFGAPQQSQPTSQAGQQQWWHRPPLKIRHDVAPVWGLQLPAVEVFGLFVTAQQLLIAAALTIFFGWRMLVFLAVVFVIVKVNSTPPAAPRSAASSGPGAAADFICDYMATNPTRPSSEAKDPWGGRGKGQKLGSK